jgi:hypothetical protein
MSGRFGEYCHPPATHFKKYEFDNFPYKRGAAKNDRSAGFSVKI